MSDFKINKPEKNLFEFPGDIILKDIKLKIRV